MPLKLHLVVLSVALAFITFSYSRVPDKQPEKNDRLQHEKEQPAREQYDRELAHQLLALSSLAYYDHPVQCKEEHEHTTRQMDGFDLVGTHRVQFKGATLAAVIAVLKNRNVPAIAIAFRGTESIAQLCAEVQCVVWSGTNYFFEAHSALMDHGGFDNLRKYIKDCEGCDVMVTGHSLGGALASITARNLHKFGAIDRSRLFLYTFGMPRVGNQAYAEDHERRVTNSFRVVNYYDTIQTMPWELYGYQHHGPAVYVDSDGHISYPVNTAESHVEFAESSTSLRTICCNVINSVKNYVSDTFADAPQALKQSINFTHHTEYFGEKVGGYCHEKTVGWFEFVGEECIQEECIQEYIPEDSDHVGFKLKDSCCVTKSELSRDRTVGT